MTTPTSPDQQFINTRIEDVVWYGIEFMLKLPQYVKYNGNAFKEVVNIGQPAVEPLIPIIEKNPEYLDMETLPNSTVRALGNIGDARVIQTLESIRSKRT
jgi:hypothetical protein